MHAVSLRLVGLCGGCESVLTLGKRALQSVFDRSENGAENGVFVAETHLRLGGMDVDVHFLERHDYVEDVHGIGALDEIVAVGFVDRRGDGVHRDGSAVDDDGLSGARGRGIVHFRDVSAHSDPARRLAFHRDETPHVEVRVDSRHRGGEVAAGMLDEHPLFVAQREAERGV